MRSDKVEGVLDMFGTLTSPLAAGPIPSFRVR
jgi:hypothetical protein